jgi:hypothetical protein
MANRYSTLFWIFFFMRENGNDRFNLSLRMVEYGNEVGKAASSQPVVSSMMLSYDFHRTDNHYS